MFPNISISPEDPGQWGIEGSEVELELLPPVYAGVEVERAAAALPQTDTDALFTVTGRVKLVDIIGIVTVQVGNVANNTKLIANPTVGADVDLCAVASVQNDAVGTIYGITGTLATALQKNANGVLVYQAAAVVLPAGTIDINCAASDGGTGRVAWTLHYIPLEEDAEIVAA